MRITQSELTADELYELGQIDIQRDSVEDLRITTDLVHDIYTLLATESVPTEKLKNNWQIFQGIRQLYKDRRMSRLIPSVRFHRKIRNTLKELSQSEPFGLLRQMMDPLEATRYLLEMIEPKQSGGGGDEQGQQGDSDSEQTQGGRKAQQGQDNNSDGQDTKDESGRNGDQNTKTEDEDLDNAKDSSQTNKSSRDTGQKGQGDTQSNPGSQSGQGADIAPTGRRENIPTHEPVSDSTEQPIDKERMANNLNKLKKLIEGGLFDEGFRGDMARKNIGIEPSGAGRGSCLRYLRTVLDNIDDITDDIVKSDGFLNILRVARNLELVNLYDLGEDLSDSLVPQNEMTIGRMQNTMDILRALPTELLNEDDILSARIAKKEVQIKQYQHRQARKQALYVLVDASGSMSGDRSNYAQAVVIAMLEHAVRGHAKYFFRFFDDKTSDLHSATNEAEAEVLLAKLRRGWAGGGGTDIGGAIQTAITDIREDPTKFDRMGILCITDGESYDKKLTRQDLRDIELHMIQVGSMFCDDYWEGLSTHRTLVDRQELNELFPGETNYFPF